MEYTDRHLLTCPDRTVFTAFYCSIIWAIDSHCQGSAVAYKGNLPGTSPKAITAARSQGFQSVCYIMLGSHCFQLLAIVTARNLLYNAALVTITTDYVKVAH